MATNTLAIDLPRPVSSKEYRHMVRKANKLFDKAIRYRGKPTATTWDRFIIY